MNVKKGLLFTAAGLLPAIALSLEAATLFIEMACGSTFQTGQTILHWILTCCLWGISSVIIWFLAKKLGFNMLKGGQPLTRLRHLLILCAVAAGILYMCSTWSFQFKPLVEWANMRTRHGAYGPLAFGFQYLYYLFECILLTIIVALGQKAGECFLPSKAGRSLPWGGILCALSWGMLHALSKDWNTALLCILLSILFGVIYQLSHQNTRYTYLAISLIFLL